MAVFLFAQSKGLLSFIRKERGIPQRERISLRDPHLRTFSCGKINVYEGTAHLSESPSVLTTAPTRMPRLTNMEVTTRIVDISITISGN
jgi:hypothetical protein